jgi:prepilin-type N-terminal cleavage/methylation domain-containing protein
LSGQTEPLISLATDSAEPDNTSLPPAKHFTEVSAMRKAFTLVELLVVIGVALVLMTLAVAFLGRTTDRDRVTGAVSSVQNWLTLAKNWAMRDQAPRGLRLTHGGNGLVMTLYYIEQPDDWQPGGTASIQLSGTSAVLQNGAIDFSGSKFGAPDDPAIPIPPPPDHWPILASNLSPLDFLEVGSGSKAQLAGIKSLTRTTLTLNTNIASTTTSNNFRVVRSARVRTGEAPLQLPSDVVIDLNTNGGSPWYGGGLTSGSPANSVDIMFGPSGQVLNASVPIRLWLRDTSKTQPTPYTFDGVQNVVSVNPHSAMVSTAAVDVTPDTANPQRYADPYSFARNPRSSGQ